MIRVLRGGSLQRVGDASVVPEHPGVSAALAELADRALRGGASSCMFLPEPGVAFDAFAFAYHTGLAKELNITGAKGAVLRGTLVVNVSGHATGDVADRVLGWAEQELTRRGAGLGDDAKRLLALRSACTAALTGLQRGAGSVDIAFEGKTLTLSQGTWESMKRAMVESTDPELVQLATLGNQARLRLFGAENTYCVRIRNGKGEVKELTDLPRNRPERIELATRIPIELPLLSGETVLEAWPTGSAGAEGYVEARRYRIHFGKGLFDEESAAKAADGYEAAHPEIRWGSVHERDDLSHHQVSPSPRPHPDF